MRLNQQRHIADSFFGILLKLLTTKQNPMAFTLADSRFKSNQQVILFLKYLEKINQVVVDKIA
jgi:hypothetical protein